MSSVLAEISRRAAADSPLWAGAVSPDPPPPARFAGACPDRYLLGVEMIHEAYLLHRGRSRVFSPPDEDLALLAGDYLYAAGLVEICHTGDLRAVAALAELIAQVARAQCDRDGDGDEAVWAATVASLGG
jgi:hypothetical protein